jgi:hypothetical protein
LSATVQSTDFRIAVVIPTRVGWPGMRISVDALLPQLAGTDAQLIIADASGRPVPDIATDPRITWIELPGVPGYDLRTAGYAAARAPVLAITEDHCAPSSDWLAELVAAHGREPMAACIYGLVLNGSRESVVDWALYSVGYLAWAPPAPAERGTPGHANLSFKAWTFEALPPRDDQRLEFRYVAALRDAGYRVVASSRPTVTHYQHAGIRATTALLFHNGRAIAGLRRDRMAGLDLVRTVAPLWIAGYRTLRTLALARTKPGIEAHVWRSAPMIAALHLAHASGEVVGYLGGPGRSGTRLH